MHERISLQLQIPRHTSSAIPFCKTYHYPQVAEKKLIIGKKRVEGKMEIARGE
jgi:hypothetical protein